MKLNSIPLALSALLLSGASILAIAADEPTKPTDDKATQGAKPAGSDVAAQMKGLDTDGNGLIGKTEAEKMKGLSEGFDVADGDKDGTLDASEFAAALAKIKK